MRRAQGAPRAGAAAALLSAAACAAAGTPQCPLGYDYCLAQISSAFYDAAYYSFNVLPHLVRESPSREVLRYHVQDRAGWVAELCSAENWRKADRCLHHCPLALVVSEPLQLRMCLAPNNFIPTTPEQHLDLNHPLNGRELRIVTAGQGCEAEDYQGGNVSGAIVLLRGISGGFSQCGSDRQAALAREAGAAAAVISDSGPGAADLPFVPRQQLSDWYDEMVIRVLFSKVSTDLQPFGRFAQMLNGSAALAGPLVTAMARAHEGDALFSLLSSGRDVRGRLELDCSLPWEGPPEDPPPADSFGRWYSSALFGDLCAGQPDPADRIGFGCRAQLHVPLGSLGNGTQPLCIDGNSLLPRREATYIAGGRNGTELVLELHSAARLLEFDCWDDPAVVLDGYGCEIWPLLLAQEGGTSCADIAHLLGWPDAMVQYLEGGCRRACGTGTKCGCGAADYRGAQGLYLVVNPTPACLPLQMVRAAEAMGVAGLFFLSPAPIRQEDSEHYSRLVVGASALVNIPVHSIPHGDSRLLQHLLAASAHGSLSATLTINDGEWVNQTSANVTEFPLLQIRDGFRFTATVVVCVALCGLMLGLVLVKCVHGRFAYLRVRVGPARKDAGRCKVPLGAATMGLSLSLLVAVAAASFTLTYNTGKDTTDTALDDGWEAVETTHQNAVYTVEVIKNQMLTALVAAVDAVIGGIIQGGIDKALSATALFARLDGSWDTFERTTSVVPQMNRRSLQGWVLSVVTEQGFYRSSSLKNDDRADSVRQDGLPRINVTNNGRLYDLLVISDGRGLDPFVVPRRDWDPLLYVARTAGFNLTRRLTETEGRSLMLVTTDYSAPVPYAVISEMYFNPLTIMASLHHELTDRAIGFVQMTHPEPAELIDSTFPTNLYAQNLSVVVFDSELKVMMQRSGNPRRVIEDYGHDYAHSDRITVPLTLLNSHEVWVNAAAAYGASLDGGWRESWAAEIDQREYYNDSQSFTVFAFDFEEPDLSDSSGNEWLASAGRSPAYADGARGTGRSLLLDGSAALEIDLNLTTDITRVAAALNRTLAGQLSYGRNRRLPDGRVVVLNPEGGAMLREPVVSGTFALMMWVMPDAAVPGTPWLEPHTAALFADSADLPSAAVVLLANGRLLFRPPRPAAYGCETAPLEGGMPGGVWTHVAATVDRRFSYRDMSSRGLRQPPQVCRVFINGSLYSEGTVASVIADGNFFSVRGERYRLGLNFRGRIDEVRAYNTTLGASEVASVMRDGVLRRAVPSRRWYVQHRPVTLSLARWGVLAMLPRQDMMREVDRINDHQHLNQSTRRTNTERKVTQSTVETVLVIAVLGLWAILVFMAFNDALTTPFASFARQLSDVGRMKLDHGPSQRSMLLEMHEMHLAMAQVVKNLREYSAYLPQAALISHMDSGGLSGATGSAMMDDVVSILSGSENAEAATDPGDGDTLGGSMNPLRPQMSTLSNPPGRPRRTSTGSSATLQSSVGSSKRGASKLGSVQVHRDLSNRAVSVVKLNIVGYRDLFRDHSSGSLAAFHELYISEVISTAAAGVIDIFLGDRVTVAFNAHRTCSGHRLAAADCAAALTDSRSVLRIGPRGQRSGGTHHRGSVAPLQFAAGVGSGTALVGSLGAPGMKRFGILGNAPVLAHLLERMATALRVRCLCDSNVRKDAEAKWAFRSSECVMFEKMALRRPMILGELRCSLGNTAVSKDTDQEEWMYCIQENESKLASMNPWNRFNIASEWRWRGDLPQALSHLAIPDGEPCAAALKDDVAGRPMVVADLPDDEGESWKAREQSQVREECIALRRRIEEELASGARFVPAIIAEVGVALSDCPAPARRVSTRGAGSDLGYTPRDADSLRPAGSPGKAPSRLSSPSLGARELSEEPAQRAETSPRETTS
eukprot:TRINITY_DN820_c0_g1_i1.p1 TRINITY_DN820_c0_g1~~TRINITY_DN820_c0_g1_i1.p1  ORF type:complete len:1888 (+),score=520.30 TRINITY_DN820_c0_g1_i1:77-5740(+)